MSAIRAAVNEVDIPGSGKQDNDKQEAEDAKAEMHPHDPIVETINEQDGEPAGNRHATSLAPAPARGRRLSEKQLVGATM